MNVLSLFDGISCGHVALDRANIDVGTYYASEIDKYATKVSEANYPDIVRLGDITKWREWDLDWSSINLVTAGFPCQSWSMAGQQLGDRDERGALFWVTLDVISKVLSENPKAKFMMENVRMKKEFEDYITHHTEEALGYVEKTLINSALVSAQNRNRFYWTNFKVSQPTDEGILLQDIIEDCGGIFQKPRGFNKGGVVYEGEKSPTLTSSSWQSNNFIVNKSAMKNGKSYTLTASYNGAVAWNSCEIKQRTMIPVNLSHDMDNPNVYDGTLYRKLTPLECERLQTLPQYTKTMEIILCYDLAKSFVSAVEKNPKLLKLVSSAGSEELKECAKLVSQNMNASQASIKYIAHQSADMQTQAQTKRCTRVNQGVSISTASPAESITMYKQVESEEGSVVQPVFITITEGKITHYGKEVLPQKEQVYTEKMSGKIALRLSGKETMQNANDALSALEMMQTNQNSISITSFRLSTKNLEQILTISYWFAKSAIDGFTQDTTQKKTLYLTLIDGYTAHVSNTQRYKAIGNGWTVDVIAHIFKGLK